jgi:hypothetical protein
MSRTWRNWLTRILVVAVVAATASIRVSGEPLGSRFLASLRIARPKAVTASAPAPAGGRRLADVVIGIAAETTDVASVEDDRAVPSLDSATRATGFRVRALANRSDAPTVGVIGTQRLGARINRGQLSTLLAEAGRRDVRVDQSLDAASLAVEVPRGARVQYGNCPAPIAPTLQNQINGPPPPSMDNGNCVVLTQIPVAAVASPAKLDTVAMLEIADELMGMSPNQARDFQRVFGWRAALATSPPRFVRSYDVVRVGDRDAMLLITGGRRGPTYALTWTADGIVYTLTGYGSSADAVALANSAR